MKKIGINDLMVGNYVEIEGYGYHRIDDISDTDGEICDEDGELYSLVEDRDNSQDVIKGILLTPKFLVDNRFETTPDGIVPGVYSTITCWTGYGTDNEGDIEVEFRPEEKIHVKIDIPGYFFVSDNIKYIHQLQNIFTLFNIDKELSL